MFDQKIILERLLPLLAIDSVKSEPSKSAPFGEGVKRALDYVLDLARNMGFETKNYDNYVGEVTYGCGKPFGVLCHLDVVPVGNERAWKFPPFSPTICDGKLYCRGAIDDKSAAISVLSALYELKEQGFTLKRQIKLILGCDEESGWGCIDHYKQVASLPEEGFSPDADFPVIYAEKGILHVKYRFEKRKEFQAFGGVKANVVCDAAEAKGDFSGLKTDSDNLRLQGDTLKAIGKTAHGSAPEKGDNALRYLTAFLEENGFLGRGITDKLFGAAEGAKTLSDETGRLTFSPDVAETDDRFIYYTVDVRYPATIDKAVVETYLKRIGEYEILSFQPPLFADKNSELVKTLMGVYKEVSGDNAEPIAIGGGTYARALEHGVAFGPCVGEECDLAHMPNEYITLKTLNMMTEIYYKALYKICVE